MGRAPCCDERLALKKGPWTPDEDEKLVAFIQEHGHGNWRALPEKAGLARCGKSCRLRWTNYLRPDIKRGRFSNDEDQMIIQLHAILGNRWSAIASHLPMRTDNEIKNYWNTHLKKRLALMGIDPVTHQTSVPGVLSSSPDWTPLVSARLTHMTQWQIALAEAEARLTKSRDPSPQLHPSAFFMRSWKTKVEDTLRPAFGTVTLDTEAPFSKLAVKNYVAPFSSSRLDGFPESDSGLGCEVKPVLPDHLMDMYDNFPSRCSGLSYNYDRVENVSRNVYDSSEGVAFENHFSPTSILQGPDSSDSSSANNSDPNSDSFAFLRQSSVCSSYQSFPLISGEPDHDGSPSMSDLPETFWQAAGSSCCLLDDVDVTATSAGGLELMGSLDFSAGDDHAFPPFESSSLCHGAQ